MTNPVLMTTLQPGGNRSRFDLVRELGPIAAFRHGFALYRFQGPPPAVAYHDDHGAWTSAVGIAASEVVSDVATAGTVFKNALPGNVCLKMSRPWKRYEGLPRMPVGVQPSPPVFTWDNRRPCETVWIDVAETPPQGSNIYFGPIACLRDGYPHFGGIVFDLTPKAAPDAIDCPPASVLMSQATT